MGLRAQAKERERILRDTRSELHELKIECAKLGSQVAELRAVQAKPTVDPPPLPRAQVN